MFRHFKFYVRFASDDYIPNTDDDSNDSSSCYKRKCASYRKDGIDGRNEKIISETESDNKITHKLLFWDMKTYMKTYEKKTNTTYLNCKR